MKTIGLVGGMTWYSTLEYYRIINEVVSERLGKSHSGKILIYSFDFDIISEYQSKGEWEQVNNLMQNAAKKLKKAGADFIVFASGTVHKIIDKIIDEIDIPILDIRDVVGCKIRDDGIRKVGLLGTSFTMTEGFYKNKLRKKYGIDIIIPNTDEILKLDNVIFNELAKGKMEKKSKIEFQRIIDRLEKKGVQAIVLGCTELPLLTGQNNPKVRFYDSMRIHAVKAAEIALENKIE